MVFKATIHLFVDVEDEPEACDCISEALRPLLRRFEPESSVVDWSYAHGGKTYTYPVPATQEEISNLED